MIHHFPMNAYPARTAETQQHEDFRKLLDAAKTGAVVGTTGAAAVNLHRLRQREIEWQEALSNTVKVGISAGVATAAATAVGRMFTPNSVLSLAATLVTGTAVMYTLNSSKQEQDNE